MVIFRLNNQTVNNPLNWQDFGIRIFREQSINGLFIEYTTELQWDGQAYALIRNVFEQSLGCDLIDVQVIYDCNGLSRVLLNGYIIISDCSFDLQRCIVKTKVFDNNYSSRINNNKSIEADAYLTESKNKVSLPPIAEITTQFFDPNNGVLFAERRVPSVYLYDYFKQLVLFMSDNTVQFASTVFDVGGEYRGLTCMSGLAIRSNQKAPIFTSFVKLFEAIHKKLNLCLFARGSVLHIEKRDDVFDSGISIQIDNIRDLIQYIDKERLASAVNVGNDIVLQEWECNNGNGCTNPQVRGFTFQDDQFGFEGVCNIDSVIDLKAGQIVFDSNVIEDVLLYGNQSYDRSVFIVDTLPTPVPTNQRAVPGNPLGIGSFFYYNTRLANDKVIQNYADDLPNIIGDYVEPPPLTPSLFRAERTGIQTNLNLAIQNFEYRYSDIFPNFLPFQNLISGTQFDPVTNTFTAQSAGIYNMDIQLIVRFTTSVTTTANIRFKIIASRRNANGNLVDNFEALNVAQTVIGGQNTIFQNPFSIFLNSGDTIRMDAWITVLTPFSVDALFLAAVPGEIVYFECLSFDPIQVIPPVINPGNFNRVKYEFNRPMSFSNVLAMLDNPEKSIRITNPALANGRECFIDEVQINNLDKFETTFKLISNI
jgi:hypothetical protein